MQAGHSVAIAAPCDRPCAGGLQIVPKVAPTTPVRQAAGLVALSRGEYALFRGVKMSVMPLLFGFKGRLDRTAWWIATILANLGLGIVFAIFGVPRPSVLILLLLVPPLLWILTAVQVKRWHDRNKSGWWLLMNVVPIIGWIWVLIECGFMKGTTGSNRFDDSA
jgi:uncharacterized membrane protein YhaH (DUF805 family)